VKHRLLENLKLTLGIENICAKIPTYTILTVYQSEKSWDPQVGWSPQMTEDKYVCIRRCVRQLSRTV
jgi:hypothetical protein